jgi:DNA-binding NarL/FixJ family response regulator
MGVTNELEEEVRRVLDALDHVEAMEDPVAQARAVAQLLKDQQGRNKRLKQLRDDTVRQLRAEGKSLRKIAAEVQVSLGTVQDILRGHGGTWSSRPKRGSAPSGGESGDAGDPAP